MISSALVLDQLLPMARAEKVEGFHEKSMVDYLTARSAEQIFNLLLAVQSRFIGHYLNATPRSMGAVDSNGHRISPRARE